MKLKDVFEKSVQFFKDKKIETARLDAELLISHVLRCDRLQIYLKYEQPLSENEINLCRDAVRRRSQGEPVAYITGERGFYGELFSVGPGVLIPRPETELIVEQALQFIAENKIASPRILDLGAGTGCIGFAILKNRPEATLVSVEKSVEAFHYLEKNRSNLELTERAELVLGDAATYRQANLFDIVVANPPYIDVHDTAVQAEVKMFEPSSALFSDQAGLKDIREWAEACTKLLKTPGCALFEIGYQQGQTAKKIFDDLKFFKEAHVLKDLSQLDRIMKATHT